MSLIFFMVMVMYGTVVPEPSEVVKKKFFIDLGLPLAAVRGEQIEVNAVLHNYSPDPDPIKVSPCPTRHECDRSFP